jgi:hypothetical protein
MKIILNDLITSCPKKKEENNYMIRRKYQKTSFGDWQRHCSNRGQWSTRTYANDRWIDPCFLHDRGTVGIDTTSLRGCWGPVRVAVFETSQQL